MNAITYAAVLGTAFVVGAAAVTIVAAYLIDRQAGRRRRSATTLRDPYQQAQELAARRRERVPAHAAGRGGAPWS
ncbi:hypothetical protein Athai_50240 [Actinocatenispora thailandica]|uniref:Uncharacterized protein n=1 Tax=Actinocatenispora thailandica TaxID=227318 RepID=A0A7R7HZI0_9ACTN|nr:hypothetical protein [Actinocatenispora thailandica]BCJ37521.1 hypothetical protein Athai_50240 [Actinocatenispora thailandica]